MDSKKYTYLSGPMTGIEHFNHWSFNEAAAHLRFMGMKVWSPAEHDVGKVEPYEDVAVLPDPLYNKLLAEDLDVIRDQCDSMVMLPGWQFSKGARAERNLAISLGYNCFELCDLGLFLKVPEYLSVSGRTPELVSA